ncbi:MAG: uroporphyrinogen methyltransferase / synthase [Gaiellales bacterium]|nr:uroporphyrinogen methyltransferase / synthase [Gaiellales bacterium]
MTVYLVGAGPGDPRLVTVRGADLLRRADVVVYDRLAGDALLDLAPSGCLLIDAGKGPGDVTLTQDETTDLLIEHGRRGALVVRLKGGDPFVFGRGGEEAQALREAGVAYEIVPGISSAIAVPAYAGVPVTHRDLAAQVTIVTGHERPGKPRADVDWAALAGLPGTLVVLMGVARLGPVAAALIAGGKAPETPVCVTQSGTTAAQRSVVGTLATIAADVEAAAIRSPAVTVVGAVAALREELAWAELRPLHGRRIVVTRARAQASGLVERLRDLGAEVDECAVIRIEPLAGPPLDAAAYGLICVTSPNAPRLFLERCGGDARALAAATVAAIGPGTAAALREVGLVADVVAERSLAEGLLEALPGDLAGVRALVARAEAARDTLPEGLRAAGAEVDVVPLYRTLAARPRHPERMLSADAVAFTSSSTVTRFAEALAGHDLSRIRGVSIGPVTSATARDLGVGVIAEAAAHDLDGLVATLVGVLSEPPQA